MLCIGVKDVRHSREGGNPEERKSGFRIKCGMTNYYIHFQLLLPRSSARGSSFTNKFISMKGLIKKSLLTSLYQREEIYPLMHFIFTEFTA
jgi:hypothetical protein